MPDSWAKPSQSSEAGIFSDVRLRAVFCIAVLLTVWSNVNDLLAVALNRAMGTPGAFQTPGWSVLMLLRVLASAGLVALILRLPQMRSSQRTASLKGAQELGRFFDPLLGLRAMACLMVMFGHYFLVVFPADRTPGAWLVTRTAFGFFRHSSPWGGVWVFFTLSGYLMGKGFARGRYALNSAGVRSFYRNRLLRIAPLYLAAVLLFATFLQPEVFLPQNWWQLAQVLVFDYRGDVSFSVIGALWSVCTEVQFYLLAPFLFAGLYALHQRWPRAFWVGVGLLYPAFTLFRLWGAALPPFPQTLAYAGLQGPKYPYFFYPTLLPNLDVFLVGMSLNLLPRFRMAKSLIRSGPGLLAVGVLTYVVSAQMATYVGAPHLPFMRFWAIGPMVTSGLAAIFIALAEQTPRIVVKRTAVGIWLRMLEWTGTLAYALYVFHSRIFISIRALLPAGLLAGRTQLRFVVLAFGLTYAVATFFYLMVEKPFEKQKRVIDSPVTDAP
jgi:peptidoglycan/LPS O-acetylase OafA/YrhL